MVAGIGSSASVNATPRANEMGLVACHVCGTASAQGTDVCPCCRSRVHARKPHSIARSWALLIAALIFYIPSNLLPVMYTSMLGKGEASTILHGVIEFWKSGSWDIALLIFIASVVVPSTKFLVLCTLLLAAQRHSGFACRQRTFLYRCIEFIGYWSMLDVTVVALVAGLMQFHALGTAEPRLGIVFFGMVVVLTMLAAMSFDPRLIWDGVKPNE